MHGFWSVLEWGANTILFVWMGIVLAIVLPPSHQQTAITNQPIHLEARDAGYVVVLYLWLQVRGLGWGWGVRCVCGGGGGTWLIRSCVGGSSRSSRIQNQINPKQVARTLLILICWLPFNYTGYPLTWRSAFVIVWGGLRGAVGMVMSLFIFLDTKIYDPSFKSYCIFYMGTMAFFTVLINGGTTKFVLQRLGFMSYTPEQLATLQVRLAVGWCGWRGWRLGRLGWLRF